MKVFDLDPTHLRELFRAQGWLHIRSGLTEEFLGFAQDHVRRVAAASDPLSGAAIKGAKEQFVFPFPDGIDLQTQVHGIIAELTGLDPSRTVLSERHVKAYLPDADPAPLAHKDRFASQIAVGLTLAVGEDSHVVLWPRDEQQVNEHLTTGLRDSLRPDQMPEAVLDVSSAVMLRDAPGDVLVFHGSRTWHLRRNSASTTLVYLKFNDFGSDPLAEDPTTPERQQTTRRVLAEGELATAVPALARTFDSVARETGLLPGRETWAVNVWQDGARTTTALPADWVPLVEAAAANLTVAELAARGVGGLNHEQVHVAVRSLAERGVLDLLPS